MASKKVEKPKAASKERRRTKPVKTGSTELHNPMPSFTNKASKTRRTLLENSKRIVRKNKGKPKKATPGSKKVNKK